MTNTDPAVTASVLEDRDLDLAALKALAHPLRVEIFNVLSTYGSFTASGLAERLGESSGATSYHLRQLEKHGLVEEVPGKGTSRERWWERTPGAVNIGGDEALATQAGRSAAIMIYRELRIGQEKLLADFVNRAPDELSKEWQDASALSTANARLTAPQLAEFNREFSALIDKYIIPNKHQKVPGSRPVQVSVQAFPILDGDVA